MDARSLATRTRGTLREVIEESVPRNVAVALSGGMDSTALILSAALDCKRNVTAITFHVDGWVSGDFSVAAATANSLDVGFESVALPTSKDVILGDIKRMAHMGCRLKSEFECLWPFLYVYERMRHLGLDSILVGIGVDTLFGIGRQRVKERHPTSRFDTYRKAQFALPVQGASRMIQQVSGEYGIKCMYPFRDQRFLRIMLGTPYWLLNKPREKETLRRAFHRELRGLHRHIPTHRNFQCADSKIKEQFRQLLPMVPGAKTSAKVFNAVLRGEL